MPVAIPERAALPTYGGIVRLAWPMIIANASAPLLGLADTAVLGNTGSVADLGAVALGALIFSFVYWAFGFLRMGTSGFTAQAAGAGDEPEVRAAFGRSLSLGFGIGVTIVSLQAPIGYAAFGLLSASDAVEELGRLYFDARIWGAPASLMMYAAMGSFVGLGKSRYVLVLQLFLNGLNIALDVLFAGVFGWGARGIGLGTALAEWSACALGLLLVLRLMRARRHDAEGLVPWQRLRDFERFRSAVSANADILIRTLALLAGFVWFVEQSARFGDTTLAANYVLLQFLSFGAFFLDGFAYVVEAIVGGALGAGDRARFEVGVRRTTLLAAATACLLAVGFLTMGPGVIQLLSDAEGVRQVCRELLPWAALYILLSFAAYQLDGIFIGTARTRSMRNASVAAFLIFVMTSLLLVPRFANLGLWLSFNVYVVARALTLSRYYPELRRRIAGSDVYCDSSAPTA